MYPGTYTENINYNGKDLVVVHKMDRVQQHKAKYSSQPIVYFNNSETDDAVLDGFTLTGGGDNNGSAINISSGNPRIENSIIKNNSNNAVYVKRPSVFKNSLFYDNPVSAIKVSTGNPAEFVNCTIANNGVGIYNPIEPNDVILKNTIVYGNSTNVSKLGYVAFYNLLEFSGSGIDKGGNIFSDPFLSIQQ